MYNGKEGAFALVGTEDSYAQGGLTKREYFAGLAMQGLLVNIGRNTCYTEGDVADLAVKSADALLAELAK
jgi:hypothetical protein